MSASEPETGRESIVHTGPETLNITGAAIGRRGPDRPPRPQPAAEPGSPSLSTSTILNSGTGQIIMDGCIIGPGATLHYSPRRPEPEPEAEL